MSVRVVLVTGVDPTPMAAATLALQLDLPAAVAVHHRIDPEREVLTRVVSDVTGVLEREDIELAHACVSCALREDVLPTLERLARDGRWRTILAHLPVGAEASQVCHVVAWDPRLARLLRIDSVVAALVGETVVDDLLGDDLLVERGQHSSHDDVRGVGETASGMVEHSDVVTTTGTLDPTGRDLIRALARPDAALVAGCEALEVATVSGRHLLGRTHAWSGAVRSEAAPPLRGGGAWRIELDSERAFHPQRLRDGLEALGGGRHRSRGCFWLPTRPGRALEWDGSGGQLSIGSGEPWGRRRPRTRLLLTGVGTPPSGLQGAFEALLLTPAELTRGGWDVLEDGFEAWLGPIREVA